MSNKNYEVSFLDNPVFDGLDEFFNLPKAYRKFENTNMKTDIKEEDNHYVMTVDIPGADKENINLELKDGYLNISYTLNSNEDEEKHHGKYLRKERYYGSMSRSFYVGKEIKENDIDASYKNGVLTVILPKLDAKKEEQRAKITIK